MTINMPIIDQECLLEALNKMGFVSSMVNVNESPVRLIGYEGVRREETAEIIIPKRYVGSASNDMGFRRTPKGYVMIVSDYDSNQYGSEWKKRLVVHYKTAYEAKLRKLAEEERIRIEEENRKAREVRKAQIIEKAKKMGYMVKEENVGNQIKINLIKRVY